MVPDYMQNNVSNVAETHTEPDRFLGFDNIGTSKHLKKIYITWYFEVKIKELY